MGFGIDVKVKVEVPKVEVPKVDVGAAVAGVASAATSAVSSATSAVSSAIGTVTAGVAAAVDSVTSAAASLASVPGALAEVAVAFTGACVDLVLEPHLILDANASWGDTEFKKGPIWIRIDLTTAQAAEHQDTLHLYSATGAYDQSKRISDYVDSSATSVDVLFEDAPMEETFSLEVIHPQGERHVIFSGVSYGNLRKNKRRFLEGSE